MKEIKTADKRIKTTCKGVKSRRKPLIKLLHIFLKSNWLSSHIESKIKQLA